MGRRPEPETFDAEPPEKPIRPDQGYRVGARITVGGAGRTRLAGAIATGIILAGIVFAAIGPTTPELPVGPVPRHAPATALPAVAILHPPGPTRPLPVYAGGLRWLDPRTGLLSGDPYTSARTGLFVDTEGHGLCVCLEIPWSQQQLVTRITLRRYSAVGEEIDRVTLDELVSVKRGVFGDAIQVDAAIAPDGRHLWIVHSVRAAQSWEIGLDRVDLATLNVEASLELKPIPAPRLSDSGVIASPEGWIMRRESGVQARLRVSPDGSTLAVLVSVHSDPGADPAVPSYQEARLDVGSDLAAGALVVVAVPARDASQDRCDAEHAAWATNRHFVTICSRPSAEGDQPFVRIETPEEPDREIDVGPPAEARDTEWLLDARNGALYRWSSLAHVFTRLQVATRAMTTLAIDQARTGVGELGTWPAPQAGADPWAPLTGPDQLFRPARLVGSPDGSVIYALGFRNVAAGVRDHEIASTGTWVFDAGRARLIAHWAPAALYDQIGFMPGWAQLVTLAEPGFDADGLQADWSTSLRFHDPRTGEVVEALGDVVEVSGFVPAILIPNVAQGIAGF